MGIVSSYTKVVGKQLHTLGPTNTICYFLYVNKQINMLINTRLKKGKHVNFNTVK